MPNRAPKNSSSTLPAGSCTDPVVGAILSGWRYDISNISPEMRTDYEDHLGSCPDCRKRRRNARIFDFAILAGMLLSMAAFLLMTLVLRRVEALVHISSVHVNLHHTAITISMEVVAVAGLLLSTVLAVLVAIATPIPNLVTGVVRERIPQIRERLARRHA